MTNLVLTLPKTKRVRRPRRPFDLVEVVWYDASDMEQGWQKGLNKVKPAVAMSAGYLIYQDEDHIVLAQDSDSDEHHAGRGQIPVGMVRKITTIRKKDQSRVEKSVPDRKPEGS